MIRNINIELSKIITSKKILKEAIVKKELEICQERNLRLDLELFNQNLLTEEQHAFILATYANMKYVNIDLLGYQEKVVTLVTNSFILKHQAIPILFKNNIYIVAISNPLDCETIQIIKALFGLNANIIVTTSSKITKIQSIVFSKSEVTEAINQYENIDIPKKNIDENIEEADILNAPAVKLVESIFRGAIASDASDIHIEPYENIVRVRYRIDGILYENTKFGINMFPSVSTRIKIMAGLNIAEKRIPQDGRINQTYDGNDYDFRVSTLPTVYGEKIVIRILDTTAFNFTRDQLGFLPEENKIIDELLKRPNGIILLTGPTGCGKSTTLYAFIKEINKGEVNIVTVEDPVEYTIEGVNQVQINNKADLTFANALRSILRQDPNIVMIGEIRDEETAEIAIRMSITGHLVFSTLHTNDAPGAVTRLVDLGVEPFFVTDALTGVIAQRLVRRLCPECKKAHLARKSECELLGLKKAQKIYEAVGCPACHNTGYKGRIGVHEILVLNPELKELVSKQVSTEEIRKLAIEKGMLTLKDTCIKYVLSGETTLNELATIVYNDD